MVKHLILEARDAALKTKVGRTITGEIIRTRCVEAGVKNIPSSAWGGVVQSLVRQGILTKTAEYARMESPQARGRKSPVYVRNSTRAVNQGVTA